MNYHFPTASHLLIAQKWGNVNYALYPAPTGRHMGVDIAGPVGSPIYAAADGVVADVNVLGAHGYGRHVIIQHDGGSYDTLYAHLHKVNVEAGQMVLGGDQIGEMGGQPGDSDPIDGASSGSHLHFEVILHNQPSIDFVKTWAGYTVDPLPYLTREAYGDPRLFATVEAPRGVKLRDKADLSGREIGGLGNKTTHPILNVIDTPPNQWAQLWSLRPEFAAVKYGGERLMTVTAGTPVVTQPPVVQPPALDAESVIRLDEVKKMIAYLEQRKSELE